ncbi:MAG TPA: phosphatidate cytidylyltransferase [Candidatus Saccharimonadales bacterium]|nr:phosphatidate cytidylyltransferase [Candidatus Saccharimonadales bacterium]
MLARRTPTAIAYAAAVLLGALGPWPVFYVLLLVFFTVGLLEIASLARRRPVHTAGGALYLLIGLAGLAALWAGAHGWLLVVILATWAADTVAYLVGSLIGRHKVAPRISPGKSWEGSVAGFAAAAAVVALLGDDGGAAALVIAIGLGPVALAGDLFESWLKRRAGAKDSGSFLPGHGGILDRIDSLLFVGPFVALVLVALGGADAMMGR